MTLRRAYWVVFAAAIAVLAAMMVWTFPAISNAVGGLEPFDLRPFGYNPDEARAFLSALSEQGREIYLGPQHALDSVYPALLAVVLAGAVWVLIPSRALCLLLIAAAFAGAGADYVENSRVATMLTMPGPVSDDIILAASRATVAKSALTTIAMIAVGYGLLHAAWMKWKTR